MKLKTKSRICTGIVSLVLAEVSDTSSTNWIKAKASMDGYSAKSVTITK